MASSVETLFPGVFRINGRLATRSLAPGTRVYGEELVRMGGHEYRPWNPYRSKLGAALVKGLTELPILPGSTVLYLGAASGTTASHVSDIVGEEGLVFCVEFAKRSMRDLVEVCESRPNMIPLLADARLPKLYSEAVGEEAGGAVDCIFEDVADPEQVRILQVNADAFLKNGGAGLIAIKARSIDAIANPHAVYQSAEKLLSQTFSIVQALELAPFELDHLFVHVRKFCHTN